MMLVLAGALEEAHGEIEHPSYLGVNSRIGSNVGDCWHVET
jgi:hypothetical protein